MKYYRRLIDSQLELWKRSDRRKPLLMRGARQVGKSSAVRHLGETFTHYIEVNFEKRPEIKRIFEEYSDVRELVQQLGALYMTPVKAGETLLFLDEIQSSQAAISSLWRFKEDYPELHVIGAGSLLEFALKETGTYGVGRITSLFVYPMSFDEFLEADGKAMWLEAKRKATPERPLNSVIHEELVQAYRSYMMVGGMPSSVAAWVEGHDYLACGGELDDIRQSYYDDFAKYSRSVDTGLLRDTLHSVIMQTGRKFMYTRVGGYTSVSVKKALGLLVDAGLIKRVSYTSANGLPLGAGVNEKFKKYIYLDSGLMLRILDMELGGATSVKMQILASAATDLVNKGGIAEMVTGWELIKYSSSKSQHDLYYWENIRNGATSEVDYILSRELRVVPMEVKSGVSGKMKSLRLFMDAKGLDYSIRTSLENFGHIEIKGEEKGGRIDIVPLYSLSTLDEIIRGRLVRW